MSYMPQQLFNMCAVTTAKISVATERSVEAIASQVTASYTDTYKDVHLAEEVAEAASKIAAWLEGAMPDGSLVGALTHMQFCIKNYSPNGKKLRRKLLGGTWFNKESEPIEDKVRACVANVATFYILTINGQVPIAPRGWTL